MSNLSNQNQQLSAPAVKISAKEFGSKYKSKYEVYRFLTVDAHCYLSPYQTVSIYFLKDICSGAKKCKIPFLTIFSV